MTTAAARLSWQFMEARTRIHRQIDASCNKAAALVCALAERDRRAIGQLTRYDHIQKRIKK